MGILTRVIRFGLHVKVGLLNSKRLSTAWLQKLRGFHLVALGEMNDSFFRPGWHTVDMIRADVLLDLRKDRLPFESASVDAFYSSHVIEHLLRENGANLFREVYRCLKKGGVFRVVTPDMDLLLERYREGDWRFFLASHGRSILEKVLSKKLPPESLEIHNLLVAWFASYSGRLDTAGGPVVERKLVDATLGTYHKYAFREWCVSMLEPGRVYAHVHLYDYDELRSSLEKAGFTSVRRSTWGESGSRFMTNPRIDQPSHRSYSLYVEATK